MSHKRKNTNSVTYREAAALNMPLQMTVRQQLGLTKPIPPAALSFTPLAPATKKTSKKLSKSSSNFNTIQPVTSATNLRKKSQKSRENNLLTLEETPKFSSRPPLQTISQGLGCLNCNTKH